MSQPRWTKVLVIALVLLGGLLPVGLYGGLMAGAPTLRPQEAAKLLDGLGDDVVLVDVRDEDGFAARHLKVAQHWPLGEIAAVSSVEEVPDRFRDKTLLLICNVGISSLDATRRLRSAGLDEVYNVRGGIQEWIGAWEGPCQDRLCEFEPATGEGGDLAFRAMPVHLQWAEAFAGVGVKGIYTVLSLGLALLLIFTRGKAADLKAVQWTVITFFIGEAFCVLHTVSSVVYGEEVYLFEYLHGYGMVLAFGFTTFAVIEGLDARAFRLTAPGKRCAALDLCGPCIKYEDVPCGARRAFLLVIPLLVVLAGIPLTVPLSSVSYNTQVVGLTYNFSYLAIFQIYDLKFSAVLAMVLLGLALVDVWLRKDVPASPLAKVLFSAGMGAFGYSMFRLLFSAAFQQELVWFDFWEEVTELLYMVAIGWVLWIFRWRIFGEESPLARLLTDLVE